MHPFLQRRCFCMDIMLQDFYRTIMLKQTSSCHCHCDIELPSNYYPISLISIFCRMVESIIKNRIMSYFQANDLFCNEQHGFQSVRSCETQLLTVMEH